jgi:hypothetical protein
MNNAKHREVSTAFAGFEAELEMEMNRLILLVIHNIDRDGSISGVLARDVYHARTRLAEMISVMPYALCMGRFETAWSWLLAVDVSLTDESSDEETDESYHEETDESSDEETDESSDEETDESYHEETDESSDEKTDEDELWEDAWDESDSYTSGKGYTLYIKFIECGRPLPSGDNYAIYHIDGGTRASWDEKSIHFKEHYLFMCRSYTLYIKNGGTRASWDEKSNKYKNNYLYPSCRHPHCHRM